MGLGMLGVDPQDIHKQLRRAIPQATLASYRQALKLQPDYPEANFNLASILVLTGDFLQAEDCYRLALQQKPNWSQAEGRLAWVIAGGPMLTPQRALEAVLLATKVCEAGNYQEPMNLDELGAALAAAGRYQEAAQRVQEAIDILGEDGEESVMAALNERLARYRAGRRYELPSAPTPAPTPAPVPAP